MVKVKISGVCVIGGKKPIITLPSNISAELSFNHFILWDYLPWWKRFLLKLCGVTKPVGNIEISDDSSAEQGRVVSSLQIG